MKRLLPRDQEASGPLFQVTWATLHLTSAVLHLGSALYHLRRIPGAARELRPLDESANEGGDKT